MLFLCQKRRTLHISFHGIELFSHNSYKQVHNEKGNQEDEYNTLILDHTLIKIFLTMPTS